MDVVNDLLTSFCHASGHQDTREKTEILFSNNTHNNVASNICICLVFSMLNDLGKYHGMLGFHKWVTMDTFHFVIDKVRMKMNEMLVVYPLAYTSKIGASDYPKLFHECCSHPRHSV